MAFELWWWVEPLFRTGVLAMFTLGIVSLLISNVKNGWPSMIFAIISVLPLAVCGVSFVVWVLANLLIAIWRG